MSFSNELQERPIYLDCAATTPVLPEIREEVLHFLDYDFGNAGSRTHEYGAAAKRRVNRAREEVGSVVGAQSDEVVFTSGATEANNLAILGLAPALDAAGRRHLITSAIEHKAVLEPMSLLEHRGFEVTYLPAAADGRIHPDDLKDALRSQTGLVSLMHVNNETGVVQPLDAVVDVLADHDAWLHVDAAQGFGKELDLLTSRRVDLISASGHKIHAPKGVGALIARRRGYKRPPLTPLLVGGSQERGLRAGTQAVHLIAGLGTAARLAIDEHATRSFTALAFKRKLQDELGSLGLQINGDGPALPNMINVSFPGADGEALLIALKAYVALSNGSACTSSSYEPSHVLTAMGLSQERIAGALRLSWSHVTPEPNWELVRTQIAGVVGVGTPL